MEKESQRAPSKHLEAFQERHLNLNEAVVTWGEGYIGEMMGKGKDQQHNGVLIVTGERVVFYRRGLLGEVIEGIPLKNISSVERKSFLGHYTIRLHTSNDSLTFKTFVEAQEAAIVAAIEAGRSSSAPGGPASSVSPATLLGQLAQLRDSGVLTDAEFQAKKTELLARI